MDVGRSSAIVVVVDAATPRAYDPLPSREQGVDLARGLALVSMFVAHAAPTPGPGGVLALSDLLTFPLFALLVGVGAELGARATRAGPHLVGTLVRATALLLVGWLLAQSGAQVLVVLAPLGVLTLLCWALVRADTQVVAAVGLLGWALAPWTLAVTHQMRWQWLAERAELRVWLLDLVASTDYPQALLVACAAVGILLARWLFPVGAGPSPRTGPASRVVAPVLAGLVGACLVLGWLGRTGRVDLVAYGTTPATDTFVLLLAAAALLGCVLLSRTPAVHGLAWLTSVGAMTLTLYVLHVGWLAYRARRLGPGELDDAWSTLVVLVVGAVVLTLGWRALRLPGGWRRGPLEGALDWTTRLLLRVPTSGVAARSEEPRGAGLTGTAGRGSGDG